MALESATKIKVVASGKNLKEVLGKAEQKGFFDHFDIKLSYQKQIIDIELMESLENGN